MSSLKTQGIKLKGYVLDKNGRLVRDQKDLDAAERRKRQSAAIKRKKR
jgi:hypothetical protein